MTVILFSVTQEKTLYLPGFGITNGLITITSTAPICKQIPYLLGFGINHDPLARSVPLLIRTLSTYLGLTLVCGAIHKAWAELKNRNHVYPDCGFEVGRDRGSAMVMYNVATNQQPGYGTCLVSLRCFSATSETLKTGSMKQLGQRKRQKSTTVVESGVLETPFLYRMG